MRTQAGTYVKEAISGEDGMTEPSVAARLGIADARCIELDVMAILAEPGPDDEPGEGSESPAPAAVHVDPPPTFGAGI